MYKSVIKNARICKGLSQDDLAEQAGKDRSSISKLENGKANPTVDTLEQVARVFDKALKIEFVDPSLANILRNSEKYSISLLEIEPCNKSALKISKTLDIGEIILQMNAPRKVPTHSICVWIWEYILTSGILENNPEAIRLTIASDYELAIYDCAESIMCLCEYLYENDDLFDKPTRCGFKTIVESVDVQVNTKQIMINFLDNFCNGERIKKALIEEKNKIKEARDYLDEHPDGFDFLVYQLEESGYVNMFDADSEYDIVTAATPEEALRKYLERDKEKRMSDYYYVFVEDFVDSLRYGFEQDDFCDAEALEHFIGEIIEENVAFGVFGEEVGERIIKRLSPAELYRFIGQEHFEQMWFAYERRNHGVSLSERQRKILEYLF